MNKKDRLLGRFLVVAILTGLLLLTPFNQWALASPDRDGDGIIDTEDECPLLATTNIITGTVGNDTLIGTPAHDLIRGLGGNDIIDGLEGNDCLVGGQGNDSLYGKNGNDILLGEYGRDRLNGGLGDDTLIGGPDRDSALGDAGNDLIVIHIRDISSGQSDRLHGGLGLDRLELGAGIRASNVMGSPPRTLTVSDPSTLGAYKVRMVEQVVVSLTVTKAGVGSGSITSNPPGINCGVVCSVVFPLNRSVTLIAAPDAGSVFDGFPDCSGGTCTITMDAARAVTATFSASVPNNHNNLLPTATIAAPSNGSTSTQGSFITFAGTGWDATDGALTDGALIWHSNADGLIGTGASFTSSLSTGPHTITLTVTNSRGMTGTASMGIRVNPFMKGVAYTSWSSGQYSGTQSDATLSQVIKPMGVNWVTLLVTCYQDTITSTDIRCNTSKTPSDADITHAINEAHRLDIRVMLKPHIDLSNDSGHWRGQIAFGSDEAAWARWFDSYSNVMTYYADLAQRTGADYFAVGTELKGTSGRVGQWRSVIHAIRRLYSGPLIYAANWDEVGHVGWWDAVDAIGVDAYYPLTQTNQPTVADLRRAWAPIASSLDLLAQQWDRPIVFTEIGYRSIDGVNIAPYAYRNAGQLDLQEQSDCYQAVFEVFGGGQYPWWGGVFWWNWKPDPNQGGTSDTGYTAHNKPAENILRAHYQRH
jgi:hypothetical protein